MGEETAGRRVLYVSYDGALEPLGASQIVAYLERLADRAAITLVTFEKPGDIEDADRMARMRARLERAGIAWIPLRYHKRPPALSTAWDVLVGCRAACRWARAGRPGIVHVRGYVAALIGLYARRWHRERLLFDMRGFWVDEKVEAGHWPPGGILFRLGKHFERRFLERADAVVSLTHAGVRELPRLGRVRDHVPIEVIPTCADLDRFQPGAADEAQRRELGLDGALVVGCVGTLHNWYLRDDTLSYLAWLARRVDRMKALIVTRDDHETLCRDAVRCGLPPDRLVLVRAAFDEMPALMRLMQVGVIFIRVGFSKRASAATKLAELLGCGVPVIINDGIGDSGSIVRDGHVGLVLSEATPAAFDRADADVRELLRDGDLSTRCREVARREFSLAAGVARYAALYDQLFDVRPTPDATAATTSDRAGRHRPADA